MKVYLFLQVSETSKGLCLYLHIHKERLDLLIKLFRIKLKK